MRIPLYIKTGDDPFRNDCGRSCPFLKLDTCLLFNEQLDDTQLPETHAWQDGAVPTKDRCFRCSSMLAEEEVL